MDCMSPLTYCCVLLSIITLSIIAALVCFKIANCKGLDSFYNGFFLFSILAGSMLVVFPMQMSTICMEIGIERYQEVEKYCEQYPDIREDFIYFMQDEMVSNYEFQYLESKYKSYHAQFKNKKYLNEHEKEKNRILEKVISKED